MTGKFIAIGLLTASLSALLATEACADPCKAIPDRGAAPSWAKPGYVAKGTVRHIGDGDSLCVSGSADPRTWVEIRLADFFAPELAEPGGPEAKQGLERITRDRQIICTVTRGRNGRVLSYDRLIAICRVSGSSVGDLMRRAGIQEGGNGH